MGLYLKGNGKGGFAPVDMPKSGLCINGDGKALATIASGNKQLFVATQNQGSLQVYQKAGNGQAKWLKLNPGDFCVDITYKNGTKQKIEFYYGSTYLSQSSRAFKLDPGVAKAIITAFDGKKREITD
jgi:hypothetical protein